MTTIPRDIQATADKIFYGLAVFDWSQAKALMAAAIFTERERCADLAAKWEGKPCRLSDCTEEERTFYDAGQTDAATSIEFAIRSQTP